MVVMRMIAQNSDQDQRSALQTQQEARPQVGKLSDLIGWGVSSGGGDWAGGRAMGLRPEGNS